MESDNHIDHNTMESTEHTHTHAHNHSHTHTQTQNVLNRLSKTIGHLNSVKRMVEDGRDCADVLVQIAAVQGALKATSRVILKDHMAHCIVEAVEEHDDEAIERLNQAIDKMF